MNSLYSTRQLPAHSCRGTLRQGIAASVCLHLNVGTIKATAAQEPLQDPHHAALQYNFPQRRISYMHRDCMLMALSVVRFG
jgi:hypothetical protein